MKKWILHILLAAMLGVHTTSCVTDDNLDDRCFDKEKVTVRFTIALDEAKATSRTWGGYDVDETEPKGELGSESENYINPNSVQVLLYDLKGTLMQRMEVVDVTCNEDFQNNHVYDLVGSFEAYSNEVSSLDFKMVVFANCPALTDLDNFYELTYLYTGWTIDTGIPMWGVGTFTGVDLSNSSTPVDAKKLNTPVYMLRSMAKVQVGLNTEDGTADNYDLNSATINSVMPKGLAVPAFRNAQNEVLTLATMKFTTDLGVSRVFNPFKTTEACTEGTLSGKDDVVYLYVPEYDNTAEDLTFTLNLTDASGAPFYEVQETEKSYSFKHGTYGEDGKYSSAMNVIRNHYYKYTVSIQGGRRLHLQLLVNPWEVVTESWSYEETVTVNTAGMIQWPEGQQPARNEVVIHGLGSTSCSFTIDSPLNAEWTAVLSPKHGKPGVLVFADAEGNSLGATVSGKVDDDGNGIGDPVTLQIKATEPVSAPNYNAAELLIYINYMGRTELVNALADSDGNFYVIRQNPQI